MTSDTTQTPARTGKLRLILAMLATAAVTAGIAALLVSIFNHKQEAKNPYIRFVDVTEETTDPAAWGQNWPRQYDSYLKTALPTRTKYGGGAPSEAQLPPEKADKDPWLTRMFAGYAFSIDYRDRRGHAYMLQDQEQTKRTTERKQPGSCLHCHGSVMPLYRKTGAEALPNGSAAEQVQKGFEEICKLDYWQANAKLKEVGKHPVSCVDCHDPKTMRLRVTRPGFINGIKALKARQGSKDYDPNRDATRQEMRSFVCGQCHVEYYCGPKVTLFFPWANGLKVEEIESTYDNYKFPDGHRFSDWTHAETGVEVIKAQHPEFEVWSQGTHARAGVSCADCHMPYMREGAMKVSDHWVRSPLLNISRACQQCHPSPETELKDRVEQIKDRHYALLKRTGAALEGLLDDFKPLRQPFDEGNRAAAEAKAKETLAKDAAYAKLTPDEQQKKLQATVKANLTAMWSQAMYADPALKEIAELQRKAQWRLDFVAAENSMGFHAAQELSRILGESIDYSRQAQVAIARVLRDRPRAAPKQD